MVEVLAVRRRGDGKIGVGAAGEPPPNREEWGDYRKMAKRGRFLRGEGKR